ncbi:MAG: FAD binding domain-containing protein [Candidatus Puniceispirillaceae bacterium]
MTFSYHKATSLNDAISRFEQADDPKFLAGGMTLLPTIRQRLAAPDQVIDLSDCGLSFVRDDDDCLVIGAMTSHQIVADDPLVQAFLPGVAMLAGHIGDRQVRVRGTIGGSIANNDPAACYPAALLALDARITTNKRTIAAADYFVDLFETALEEGEIITEIAFPKNRSSAYVKAPSPASRYAMVGVFIAKDDKAFQVAVTGAGDQGVFRCAEAEALLNDLFSPNSLDDLTLSEDGIMSDIHASSAFRVHLIKHIAKKAVSLMADTADRG